MTSRCETWYKLVWEHGYWFAEDVFSRSPLTRVMRYLAGLRSAYHRRHCRVCIKAEAQERRQFTEVIHE